MASKKSKLSPQQLSQKGEGQSTRPEPDLTKPLPGDGWEVRLLIEEAARQRRLASKYILTGRYEACNDSMWMAQAMIVAACHLRCALDGSLLETPTLKAYKDFNKDQLAALSRNSQYIVKLEQELRKRKIRLPKI